MCFDIFNEMPSLLLKMSMMVDEHSMVDSTLTDQTEMLLVCNFHTFVDKM